MRIFKATLLSLCAAALFVALSPAAKADDWNKKTFLTFSEDVEIPGQILPAGTYVFKLFDSNADRHIVQVWTEDQRQLLATIMAIPTQRPDPRGHTTIPFEERPADSPMAIHTWYYPGDTIGQEFVYNYHYPVSSYSDYSGNQ